MYPDRDTSSTVPCSGYITACDQSMVESGVTEGGKNTAVFFFVNEHNNIQHSQQHKHEASRLRLGKHIQDSWENKTNCFPRDLTLSVYYISASFSCYKVMWPLIEQKYVKKFTKSSELYIAGKFGKQNHLFTGVKGFSTPALFPYWCP